MIKKPLSLEELVSTIDTMTSTCHRPSAPRRTVGSPVLAAILRDCRHANSRAEAAQSAERSLEQVSKFDHFAPLELGADRPDRKTASEPAVPVRHHEQGAAIRSSDSSRKIRVPDAHSSTDEMPAGILSDMGYNDLVRVRPDEQQPELARCRGNARGGRASYRVS